jgi:hypothetical protein
MLTRKCILPVLWYAAFVSAPSCFAQSNQAAISGVVSDPQGGVIPGANVVAVDTATGVRTTAVTNGAGYYNLQNLPIGAYIVTVEHSGFRKYVHEGMTLTTGPGMRSFARSSYALVRRGFHRR